MATQCYTVTPHPIETLLTWVKSREIAIPEIQRPFVWDATKVRNLLDSLGELADKKMFEFPRRFALRGIFPRLFEDDSTRPQK